MFEDECGGSAEAQICFWGANVDADTVSFDKAAFASVYTRLGCCKRSSGFARSRGEVIEAVL